MKVLFICPNVATLRAPLVHNIGVSYVAGAVRAAGFNCGVLDIYGMQLGDEDVIAKLEMSLAGEEKIVVGIGTIISGFTYVNWLVREIKRIKPDAFVVIGNSVGSSIYNFIFDEMPLDAVVMGEAEETMVEFLRKIERGETLEEVKGICYRTANGFRKNDARPLITNIDEIAWPALDLFDMEIYFENQKKHSGARTIYLSTTRGCPYKCTYCYHAFQGSRIRSHSIERIISELKFYKEKYKLESFAFSDDLFMLNRERVLAFCDALDREKLNMTWAVSGRVNSCRDMDVLKRMKNSGCTMIGLGVESGDPRILENIKKRATVEMAKTAIFNCRQADIFPSCSFMIGNEGENYESVENTVKFIDEVNIEPPVTFFFATPYPDTALFATGLKKGLIKDVKELVRSYGEQGANLLVNFSQLSDEQLIKLKNRAQLKIVFNYARRNKAWFFKYIFRRAYFYMETIYKNFMVNGFKETLKKIKEKLWARINSFVS